MAVGYKQLVEDAETRIETIPAEQAEDCSNSGSTLIVSITTLCSRTINALSFTVILAGALLLLRTSPRRWVSRMCVISVGVLRHGRQRVAQSKRKNRPCIKASAPPITGFVRSKN